MKRRIASLMTCSILASQLQIPTFACANETKNEKEKVKADLEVTLNLDYPVANYEQMDLRVTILCAENGAEIVTKDINSEQARQGNGNHIVFEDLELGTYKVKLTGKGYKTYISDEIDLIQTEKHLVIDAGTDTFTVGDLNQDGKINEKDLAQIEKVLGKEDLTYDLNGDKVVDIEDLSQFYWSQNKEGKATLYNTQLILSQVLNQTEINKEFEELNNESVTLQGELSSLFDGNDDLVVELKNKNGITENTPVKIPVVFTDNVSISQITLTAPADAAPTAGAIVYVDEDGITQRITFTDVESGQVALTRNATKTIKINLGKQVPLQKLMIEVTQTSEKNGLLAAISKIEFLEDVVDNAINQEKGEIKGLKGKGLNESVSLSWNHTANVTGYKVRYGTAPGVYTDTRHTSTNTIIIDGLENLTPYYFSVQATNGDWEGPASEEIMLIPEPVAKPMAPTDVNLVSLDQGIKVTYKLGDDATGANIYYKKSTDDTYKKIENTNSGHRITDLENGTEYMIYVVATNSSGESDPSIIKKAVPVEEELGIPKIPTVNRIDNSHITNITLIDPDNVDQKCYPEGFDVKNVIDGNFKTHWTAETYQRDRGIIATFDEAYEMDYVAIVPRLDTDYDRYEGTKKYWDYPYWYTIKVWETLDSEPKTIVDYQVMIPSGSQDGLYILPFKKTKVAKIQVQLYEWHGAGAMSLSEVMFYEHHDMIERIDDLFANGIHTELKKGVTLTQINQLEKELDELKGAVLWVDKETLKGELQAAREILENGAPSNRGEIVEVVQTYQKATAQSQNFAMDGLSNLQATGVMANADDKIIVYVDAPEGGILPELVVSQFYGDGDWSKTIALKQGRNVIKVPSVVNYDTQKGGPLYLTYTGDMQEATTVRIVNATKIPTLELTSLENEESVKAAIREYVTYLNAYVPTLNLSNKATNPANSTEIGTDTVLLSLPAEEVLRGLSAGIEGDIEAQVDRLYENLLTWNVTMKLHYDVLGLSKDAVQAKDRTPETRLNVRYMPMSSSIFMYASSTHVGIQYSSGAGVVNARRDTDGYFGWGINHEIGHVINDQNYVIAEVTNNIFSLFAQTINGGDSRLETSGYEPIYQKVTSKDKGMAGNVFVTLGMFWQLHLAYDDQNTEILPTDFYPRLHKLSRETNFEGLDSINYFIRLASDTVEKDLTPFFERWGAKITPSTYKYVAKYSEKEVRPLYYLNDDAMRYRLKGGVGMQKDAHATISAQVEQDEEKQDTIVKLELSSDMPEEALLGYEIYRDGELIGFTQENKFTDEISANNVTHTYSVIAYDKLLNQTKVAYSDQVYIATEGIISKDQYFFDRTTSDALYVVLPYQPEIVGLKINDVTADSDLKVKVEISSDGENWVTAKETEIKSGTSLIYFNKPGAGNDDDRIWTYDAKYIRITGDIIESITEEQIQILSYPGDAVYFTEGAIGYLASDYMIGNQLFEKDTLVVMGSYRGHPVYNKIVLSAQYVADKDYDKSERPDYTNETLVEAIAGELYMFAEIPEDGEVSKVGNGTWLFIPKEQKLPAQIKANMFRTDDANSTDGGRLVSDTKWLLIPSAEDMPRIELE